jgi:rRNA-processing protein FCF1
MVKLQSYRDRLLGELDGLAEQYTALLNASTIGAHNWDSGFIGFPHYYWVDSSPELQAVRMDLLASVRDLEPRIRLLFPHPTPEVSSVLKESFGLLRRWAKRGRGDHSIPRSIEQAITTMLQSLTDLKALSEMLPDDEWPKRLVVDTNTLIDNPNLAAHTSTLGRRYMVHVLPVVLGELDDLKRAGRTPELREAAKKADRRLKALRDNGDVRVGARVQGDVHAVFEHVEPRDDGLPSWLNLDVPDDRLVASSLLLQSARPGSTVYVATGDLNLQNKLAAVGLPFVELHSGG